MPGANWFFRFPLNKVLHVSCIHGRLTDKIYIGHQEKQKVAEKQKMDWGSGARPGGVPPTSPGIKPDPDQPRTKPQPLVSYGNKSRTASPKHF